MKSAFQESPTRSVYANFDSEAMQHTVEFELTSEGQKKFAQIIGKTPVDNWQSSLMEKYEAHPASTNIGRARISGSFRSKKQKWPLLSKKVPCVLLTLLKKNDWYLAW